MRLYHFLNEEYGLLAIQNKRLKIGRINSFNDPFEFLHFDTENYFTQKVINDRKKRANRKCGVICFSKNFTSPVQWAHYADSHNGICLVFDISEQHLLEVQYIEHRSCMDSFKEALELSVKGFMSLALSKKFQHWSYEEEVRLIINFDKPQIGNGLLFKEFNDNLRLKEVIVGCKKNSTNISHIKKIVRKNYSNVEIKRVAPSSNAFVMELINHDKLN